MMGSDPRVLLGAEVRRGSVLFQYYFTRHNWELLQIFLLNIEPRKGWNKFNLSSVDFLHFIKISSNIAQSN